MQEQIIAMLIGASEGEHGYISGNEMATELKISRAAVWKYIESIRQAGVEIIASPGLGYRLAAPEETLLAGAITVNAPAIGSTYTYLPEIDSTNLEARRLLGRGCQHGAVVVAEHQTAGRGRMGRQWLSTPGKGLYFSVVLRPGALPMAQAPLLVPLTAVAVYEALAKFDLHVQLKWPNDLLYEGRKLGGVLLEVGGEADGVRYAILGIGINVNLTAADLSPELSPIATSVAIVKGRNVGRRSMLKEILATLETYYGAFARGSRAFLDEYRELCYTVGRTIHFQWQDNAWRGVARGIEADGALRVELQDGETVVIRSGDVHCL